MKQIRKNVILFIVCFCLLFVLISLPFYRLRDKGYQYIDIQHKVSQIEELPKDAIDVLFLGDSQAWATLNPKCLYQTFGIVSYNGATPGQWTYDGGIVLKETVKKQSLKAVVLEVSTFFSYPNRYKFLLSQWMPIFHYHGYGRRKDFMTYDSHNLGANSTSIIAPYEGGTSYMDVDYPEVAIPKHSLYYVDEMVELCKKNQIQLLFVASPSPLTWNRGKQKAVEAYSTKNNITFIDYNEPTLQQELGIDFLTDTRDGGDHLNDNGANKVTKAVGKWLKKNVELEDNRGNSKYQKWKGDNMVNA